MYKYYKPYYNTRSLRLEDIFKRHKHICWYPSAGADFRELLFLSEQYCKWKEVNIAADQLPDLFVLTDANPGDFQFTMDEYYNPYGVSNIAVINGKKPYMIKSKPLYRSFNRKTCITVEYMDILEGVDIPLSENTYRFKRSENYGKAFYMRVHIKSKQLGEWNADVLYLLTENTGFALKYLIPKKISVDYIVRVRYGDAFGESVLNGEWLLKLIKPLNVKYFLSNYIDDYSFRYVPEQLEEDGYSDMKDIWGNTDVFPLNEIHWVDGRLWSDQGDICWYKV